MSLLDTMNRQPIANRGAIMHTLVMDQHKGKQMVLRVPPRYHEKIRQLAEKYRRSINEQAKIALEEHFEKEGIWPDPQAGTPPPKPRK